MTGPTGHQLQIVALLAANTAGGGVGLSALYLLLLRRFRLLGSVGRSLVNFCLEKRHKRTRAD